MIEFVYKNLNYLLPTTLALIALGVMLASGKFQVLWIFEVSRDEHPIRFWVAISLVSLFVMMGIALVLGIGT